MSDLDRTLDLFRAHPGVREALVLGTDGLLIRGSGSGFDEETVAALVPPLASAATALGSATATGDFVTAALQLSEGVVLVSALPGAALLAVLLHPGVSFAPLLREIADRRGALAALL